MAAASQVGVSWRYLASCLLIGLWLGGPAYANCVVPTFGNTPFHNCNGSSGSSHTVSGTNVHNFNGKIGTSQKFGSTTVHNIDGKLGFSHTVSDATVHNLGGKVGTSQTAGKTTIYSGLLFQRRQGQEW